MQSFNQHNKSELSHEVFNKISKKLGIEGNVCDNLETFWECK